MDKRFNNIFFIKVKIQYYPYDSLLTFNKLQDLILYEFHYRENLQNMLYNIGYIHQVKDFNKSRDLYIYLTSLFMLKTNPININNDKLLDISCLKWKNFKYYIYEFESSLFEFKKYLTNFFNFW